jgi:hypothetical protein
LERDPSSGTDFVRATFSHKGRRKKARHVGNVAGDFTWLRLSPNCDKWRWQARRNFNWDRCKLRYNSD